jgi:hypothetical protein
MATEMNIGQYLNPTAFPATREECIQMAEDNGAPDEFIRDVSRLPEGVYDTVHEVWALVKGQREHANQNF